MATQVSISGSPQWAKIRNPVGVFFLNLIPFYGWYWWFQINRELQDLGRAKGSTELGDNPTLSMLAFGLGALVIIPFVWTIVTTTKRIQAAQRLVGAPEMSGVLAGVLWVFATIGGIIYTQSALNSVWKTQPAVHPGALGPAPHRRL